MLLPTLKAIMGLDFWSSTWLVDNILSTYIGYRLTIYCQPGWRPEVKPLSFLRCARQPAHTLYISKKLSPWYTHLHYVKVKQHFLDTWAWYHIRPDEFAHCPILQSDTPKVYFILAYTCWLSIQIEEDRDYIQATFKNFHNFSCLLSDS